MDWWPVLAFLPLALAARLRRLERRTLARLTDAGAHTAQRAILLEPDGMVRNFVQWRLLRAGVLRQVATDRYYLDEDVYRAFRRRRRRRLVVLLVVLIAIAMILYVGDL